MLTVNERAQQGKASGSQRPPGRERIVGLYRRAFALVPRARALEHQGIRGADAEQMLAITRQLRTEGDMNARRLAEEIEEAARAHL